jgi:putative membrane protein
VIERDALLHYAHFICIFLLASLLVGELLLFRKFLSADMLRQLRIVDRWYGIAAGLVIATGLSLLFLGAKGAAFYTHNPVFWTKMTLFGTVALLSISPTVSYVRWDARRAADGSVTLPDNEHRRVRTFLIAQLCVFAFIPLCATLMANGL